MRGVQKHMAEAMVRSVATAPQACVFLTVDATPTVELVDRLRHNRRFEGLHVTPLAVVARAVVLALHDHPSLNSSWDEASDEVVTKRYVHLGIAVAGPRGLVVPNIKDAQELTLRGLTGALADLTATARAGRTAPADLRDGTITVTNIGVFGVDAGVPILNPGEAAILAVGSLQRRPWEYEGELALRHVVTLSLAFDHRLVDGQAAALFLRDVGDVVADPTNLIALARTDPPLHAWADCHSDRDGARGWRRTPAHATSVQREVAHEDHPGRHERGRRGAPDHGHRGRCGLLPRQPQRGQPCRCARATAPSPAPSATATSWPGWWPRVATRVR